MGTDFQHPVQKFISDQARTWMNSSFAKFKQSASTRQVAVYGKDLNTYLGRLKREMHNRFGAYLTEQGGSTAACFDFIMNGSSAAVERKLSSTQFRNPPSCWHPNHGNHKLVAAKAQPGRDHGTGRQIIALAALPRWVRGNGHRSSWLRAVGPDPSPIHDIMAQSAQPAKPDHVILGQQR